MPQTVQGLKDFFDSSGTNDPVTTNQLLAVDAWLTDHTGIENPTPGDLVKIAVQARGGIIQWIPDTN